MRRLHSIKGNSGFLDLRHLYSLLHKAENVLQIVREMHHIHWPPGLVDLLFQVLDTVEIMIRNLEEGGSDEVDWLDKLFDELTGIENDLTAFVEVAPDKAAPVPRPDPEETGPAPLEAEPPSPAGPAVEDDPIEKIRALLDLSIQKAGEPFFDDLAGGLEPFAEGLNVSGAVNAERALDLVKSYLSQVRLATPPPVEAAGNLLTGLLNNLLSWLAIEGICPAESAAAPGRPTVSSILEVTPADMEDYGKILQEKIRKLVQRGVNSPILDLRRLQVFHSREIGALISSMKLAPDQENLGIILDEKAQHGLLKVFRVMGPG